MLSDWYDLERPARKERIEAILTFLPDLFICAAGFEKGLSTGGRVREEMSRPCKLFLISFLSREFPLIFVFCVCLFFFFFLFHPDLFRLGNAGWAERNRETEREKRIEKKRELREKTRDFVVLDVALATTSMQYQTTQH